jgi:uncharacterized protein
MHQELDTIFRKHPILTSGDCLACDVCCRFPEATSPLAPFFANDEKAMAICDGFAPDAFPPGDYGPGDVAFLRRHDCLYACPAFEHNQNACACYAARPWDCRLYPFMLTYTQDGTGITLGLDGYCPVMAERQATPAFSACAKELAAALDGPLLPDIVARRGIVTNWKEHVRPLAKLTALSEQLCKTSLGLARFLPSTAEAMAPWFRAHAGSLASHTFSGLWLWSDLFDLWWTVSYDCLIIIAQGDGDTFMIVPPLGQGDTAAAAKAGLDLIRRIDPNAPTPRIQDADAESAAVLEEAGWRISETSVEYIYDRVELAELRGNRFEKKRQMCNRFAHDHTSTWRAMTSDDLPAALALYRRWMEARCAAHPELIYTAQAEASFRCVARALREADMLGILVRILEADGVMAGFTAGYPLHDGETFHVLFEIAAPDIKGAAQTMYREFCRELIGFQSISAGTASGLPNLARTKESYRPTHRPISATLTPPLVAPPST